jgi:methyltransferase NSUN6
MDLLFLTSHGAQSFQWPKRAMQVRAFCCATSAPSQVTPDEIPGQVAARAGHRLKVLETPMSLAFRVNAACKDAAPNVIATLLRLHGFEVIQPFPRFLPETLLLCVPSTPNAEAVKAQSDTATYPEMVTVGRLCGEAVLSGADVFAPGVAEWPQKLESDNVQARIYADVTDCILRGGIARRRHCPSYATQAYLGIGILRKRTRNQVFGPNASGTAVEMTLRLYNILSARRALGLLPAGTALLQTLPSQVVGRIVAPERDDSILDMCAAPGGKTAHIAALLLKAKGIAGCGRGSVTAIARTRRKQGAMKTKLETLGIIGAGLHVVKLVAGDAAKATEMFGEAAFDTVLLDAPCTGSGTRPRLDSRCGNTERLRGTGHEVALQRRLLCVAARVVRPGGHIVYSTCSDAWEEGEGMVTWVAAHESQLGIKLVDCWPHGEVLDGLTRADLGARHGADGLSLETAELCVRFSADHARDELNAFTGFFIAKFERVV